MERILLTGATGFIGSAVLRRLLNDGCDVLALHSSGESGLQHPRLRWRQLDLLRSANAAVQSALRGEGLSHCIHAAWYTNHSDYLVHEVNRDWIQASMRLADAFRSAGGMRLVNIGTCFEYDASKGQPCSEEQTQLEPETLYARSKLDLFRRLEAQGGNLAWARVFFVYGPGDRAGRLVPTILAKLGNGEPFTPRFGGLRRDYIHVDDLAGQIVRIATGTVRGAINTGTSEAPSLSEIAHTAAQILGRPELAKLNDRTDGQPPMIASDLAKFRSSVGQPDARTIGEGLADTLRRIG